MMPPWKVVLLDVLELPVRAFRLLARPGVELFRRINRLAGLRMRCRGHIPASTQFDGPVHLVGTGRLTLGEYCRIGRGVVFETEGEGEIVIGSHVRINDGCTIVAHQRVTVGDDTLIGEFVSIRDANHGMATSALMRMQPNVALPVLIGGNVWIGRGACVLMGACLEDGVVVGANSVVTQRISENSIVAGVPARRISNRVDRQ